MGPTGMRHLARPTHYEGVLVRCSRGQRSPYLHVRWLLPTATVGFDGRPGASRGHASTSLAFLITPLTPGLIIRSPDPPGPCWAVRRVWLMLYSLTLPPLPTLYGERVILRGPRDSDVDDRLRHPIDPEEEDGYGSSWRREWDGRRYHTREYLTVICQDHGTRALPRPRDHLLAAVSSWGVRRDPSS